MKPKKKQRNQQPAKIRKYCYFCVNEVNDIDFKETQMLRRFISGYAKIVPKRRSGSCTLHQRKLANALKRARFMAMIPYLPR